LGEAAEDRALDHAARDLLGLVHDQAGEGHARDDDEEQREHDDEARGEPRARPFGEPVVGGGEDGVEHRDADQSRGVGGERDQERDAQDEDEDRGALVIRVDERHAGV